MNSPFSLSMNSSRPYESFVEKQNLNKENIQVEKEKDEKLKELLDKNERLEKECIKFQIQVKNLEDKLQKFKEKEYKSQNNTSSNFLLPSEFRKIWEDFGKESVADIFVDFFDDIILTLNLFQEIMLISQNHFKEELKNLTNRIMKFLEIKTMDKSYTFIEKSIRPIILEYYDDIFENEAKSNSFFEKIKADYEQFINKNILSEDFENNNPDKDAKGGSSPISRKDKRIELEDMLRSSYLKDFVKTIKKIFLFVEFHDPQLNLKLDKFKNRKPIIKKLKATDSILADGYIKESKNCLILIDPPLLKNGYPYSGLKPVTLICPDDSYYDKYIFKEEKIEEPIKTNESEKIKTIDDEKYEKDICLPICSSRKIEKKILTEMEKKEKIIEMILDNDKEEEIHNLCGIVNINKNLVNDSKDEISRIKKLSTEEIYNKYHDVAFSKNPNNIVKENLNMGAKTSIVSINLQSDSLATILDKTKNNENLKDSNDVIFNKLRDSLNVRKSEESKRKIQKKIEQINNIPSDIAVSNILKISNIINKNNEENNTNFISNSYNSNPSNNSLSVNKLIVSSGNINFSNEGNIEKMNNNQQNSLNFYSSSNEFNSNNQNNENMQIYKLNTVRVNLQQHVHDHNYNYKTNTNLANKSELNENNLCNNENTHSVKSLLNLNNNTNCKNDSNVSSQKVTQEKNSNVFESKINLEKKSNSKVNNFLNTSKEKYKDNKEDNIKGINIINITNKFKENEQIQNNFRKNSNESHSKNSNYEHTSVKDEVHSENNRSKIFLTKLSPSHKGIVPIARSPPMNEVSKKSVVASTQSKDSKKLLNMYASNSKYTSENHPNSNSHQNNKIIKKRPHEIQLILTNQNFNYLINEKNGDEFKKNEENDKETNSNNTRTMKFSKKIRISELDQNYTDIENLNEASKKSFVNTSNNKSQTSYTNSVIKKNKLTKNYRSTSDHHISDKKKNDINVHSYSYSYININRFNIFSSKKCGSNSNSINDSSRANNNSIKDSNNIYLNNFNNSNNLKEMINSDKKRDDNTVKNNLYFNTNNFSDLYGASTKISNNNYNNYYSTKDSYKNRYAYLSNNSNSKSKNNLNVPEKSKGQTINKNPSSGRIKNIISSNEKNERYSSTNVNSYNHSNKIINNTKKFISKNNSNDFNMNNHFISNLNKTSSNTNLLHSSKEKEVKNNNQEMKDKLINQPISIRSYTNESQPNITKKEKGFINSKEKSLNTNQNFKNRNHIIPIINNHDTEIQSSRTHTNFESVELLKLQKSPQTIKDKFSLKHNKNINEEEIIFLEYEQPNLETECDELDSYEVTQQNYLSNSFTFKKESKNKINLSGQKSKSEKKIQNALFTNTWHQNINFNENDFNHIHNTFSIDNKSIKNENLVIQNKRNSVKNKLKKQVIMKNNSNNIFIKKKVANANGNQFNLNNTKINYEYNEINLMTNTSEQPPSTFINSNFITKSNFNNNHKVNINICKPKTFLDKKFINHSNHQNSNIVNLNLTSERILDYNQNNPTQQSSTPNHNYHKSSHTYISNLTNVKNSEKVANKINQILFQQNKKSTSIKRNNSKTPNTNNIKSYNSKFKGCSPKHKGIIHLNIHNESVTNTTNNNTNGNTNLAINKNANSNNNMMINALNKESLKENLITNNILNTNYSIDSDSKSKSNNLNFDDYENLKNIKQNLNCNNVNQPNFISSNNNRNASNLMNKNHFINTNKEANLNSNYSNLKKLCKDPEELNINKTLNSIDNNSKSKEKNKRYVLNFNKYHNMTSHNKLKNHHKDKFVKYPTLKEKNNDYMLLKEEFSYYENNHNSINDPNNIRNIDNDTNKKMIRIQNININKKSNNYNNVNNKSMINEINKKSNFTYKNNYIHTTDDEEILAIENINSKINNHEINFLNENFIENSGDNLNEDLNFINFNLENNQMKKLKSNNNYKADNNHCLNQAESQDVNNNVINLEEREIQNLNNFNNDYLEYEDDILETNNSISTSNNYINNNFSNKQNKNYVPKIPLLHKETIETGDLAFPLNEISEPSKIRDSVNSNFKSSNIDNLLINDAILGSKITHKPKSKSKPNNIKENISGNSNVNSEISANNNLNKNSEKNIIQTMTKAPHSTNQSSGVNFFQGLQHKKYSNNIDGPINNNHKEKTESKNSDQMKILNSKDYLILNSGKKISPMTDKRIYDNNPYNKPNNLNMKFNYIDTTSKNNGQKKNSNTGQFINTNIGIKDKNYDKPKHNFININYTK